MNDTYIIPVHVFIEAGSAKEAYKKLCELFPEHVGWESGDDWATTGSDVPLSYEEVEEARK